MYIQFLFVLIFACSAQNAMCKWWLFPETTICTLPSISADALFLRPSSSSTPYGIRRPTSDKYISLGDRDLVLFIQQMIEKVKEAESFTAPLSILKTQLMFIHNKMAIEEISPASSSDEESVELKELEDADFIINDKDYMNQWVITRAQIDTIRAKLKLFRKRCAAYFSITRIEKLLNYDADKIIKPAFLSRDTHYNKYLHLHYWYIEAAYIYQSIINIASSLNMGEKLTPIGGHCEDELFPLGTAVLDYLSSKECPPCHINKFKKPCATCKFNRIQPPTEEYSFSCRKLYYLTTSLIICDHMTRVLLEKL